MGFYSANGKFILFWGALAALSFAVFFAKANTAAFRPPAGRAPTPHYDEPRQRAAAKRPAAENRLPENETAAVSLLFFGDLMLDRHVGEKIGRHGFDYLFARLATGTAGIALDAYDLVGANLEGAATDDGAHYPPLNAYDFAFAPALVARLKDYHFNFFNLANNHLADQGERGITETRTNLDALGFAYAGCEDGVTGDCSLKKLEVRSKKLGMAGFSMVYRLPAEEEMVKIAAELASTTDFVAVNMHWGAEYEHEFGRVQQTLARRLIDAGADIIIGHHPHVVQGLEIYRGRPIFYSLGNFIFDQYFSAATQTGLAVGFTLDDEGVVIRIFPFKSVASQIELMVGAEKEKFLAELAGWSALDDEYREQLLMGALTIKNFIKK